MSQKRRLSLVICFLLIYVCASCRQTPPAEPDIEVRYASVPAIVEALGHIANEKGFFKEQGLDVDLVLNSDGKTSLEQVLSGEADIAAVMGTPVVYQSFTSDDFYIIGKIGFSEMLHSAVGRSDHGITTDPQSLIGKRIAVMSGTSGQYFLDNFLLFNHISYTDIELINLTAPEAVDAISAGEVDAMFYWFPFPAVAAENLDKNAIRLSSEDLVPGSWVIVARKDYVEENPLAIEKFLRAIAEAEEFKRSNSEEAIQIHSEVSGVAVPVLEPLFYDMDLTLTLNQALILDLESQSRWLVSNGYVDQDLPLPNYLNFIYPDGMLAVKPEEMNIILESNQ